MVQNRPQVTLVHFKQSIMHLQIQISGYVFAPLQTELDFSLVGFSVKSHCQGECHEKTKTTFYT